MDENFEQMKFRIENLEDEDDLNGIEGELNP